MNVACWFLKGRVLPPKGNVAHNSSVCIVCVLYVLCMCVWVGGICLQTGLCVSVCIFCEFFCLCVCRREREMQEKEKVNGVAEETKKQTKKILKFTSNYSKLLAAWWGSSSTGRVKDWLRNLRTQMPHTHHLHHLHHLHHRHHLTPGYRPSLQAPYLQPLPIRGGDSNNALYWPVRSTGATFPDLQHRWRHSAWLPVRWVTHAPWLPRKADCHLSWLPATHHSFSW